jgi:hypothetical protein
VSPPIETECARDIPFRLAFAHNTEIIEPSVRHDRVTNRTRMYTGQLDLLYEIQHLGEDSGTPRHKELSLLE